MASSSDHSTASLIDETWILRHASFLDPWFTDAFSRDMDTLTPALQGSLYSQSPESNTSSSDASLAHIPTPGLNTDFYGSFETEIENVLHGEETARCEESPSTSPVQKQRKVGGGPSRKVAKRKSRATKRSQTTFIMADPASFRQMVQKVTGASLGLKPAINTERIMRPETHRHGHDLSSSSLGPATIISDCLPTLDTSALLLDRHRVEDQHHAAEMVVEGGSLDPVDAFAYDLEPLVIFPTLDSWNSV